MAAKNDGTQDGKAAAVGMTTGLAPRVKLPVVSVARMAAGEGQGGEVEVVQASLALLGFLPGESVDGTFDSDTIRAYSALQAHLGFGMKADGIPEAHSLTWLGLRTGLFTTEA